MNIKEKDVVDFLRRRGKPAFFKMLMRKLGVPKEEKKEFRKLLKSLIKKGILKYEKGKYILKELEEKKPEIVEGVVEAHPSGYGFLIIGEEVEDLFIPPPEMRYLFDGDVVLAKALTRKKKTKQKL
jgi:ribonuclease R